MRDPRFDQIRRERLQKLPHYVEFSPELLLMGITHAEFKNDTPWMRILELYQRLDDLDHLAFEATEAVFEKAGHSDTYEMRAKEYFGSGKQFAKNPPGNIIYLEDNVNRTEILERRGVSPYLFAVLHTVELLARASTANQGMIPGDFGDTLIQFTRSLDANNGMEIEKAVANLELLIGEITINQEIASACSTAAVRFQSEYLSPMRDHYVYGPKIQQMQALEGRKGVMIGNRHLPYIIKFLRGETPKEYQDFATYKQSVPRDQALGLEILSDFARRTQ